MAEKYFLMPGVTISKPGLPGKKLECKKGSEPMKIDDKHVEIIKKNLPFLISQKKVITASKLEEIRETKAKADAEAKTAETGKSEKRISLETEAIELGIEFNTKTSGKDLESMIEEVKTAPDTGYGE